MRTFNWVGCIFAAGLGGCSLYPIPDDVNFYPTEQIVRFGRCEVKAALLDYMFEKKIIFDYDRAHIVARLKKAQDFVEELQKTKKDASNEVEENLLELARLAKVGVVYSFDFNITETNKAGADAGFRLPSLTNVVDAGATGALDLTRNGSRVFGTEDSWDDLMIDPKLCKDYLWQRPANIAYPLTGSIGVGRVVRTFIDIDEQGGAKDNFVDTLTFTTLASAGANASIKLDPVPNQFRLVSATAAVGASRQDIHKLTISLAFPQRPKGGISGVIRSNGDLNAPFERPPIWRARYNLCVQDARTRESSFKMLRLTDPLVYCITYADQFTPEDGHRVVAVRGFRKVRVPVQGSGGAGLRDDAGGAATTTKTVPTTTFRQVRPNQVPFFVQ